MTNDNEKKGFWSRTSDFLFGPIPVEPSEQRSEPFLLDDGSAVLPRSTDSTVTAGNAMSLIGVYRAVSIVATAASQLPINVYRNGTEIETPSLIKQPNVDIHRPAFVEQTITSLALYGNAYWLLTKREPSDAPSNVEVLHPLLMTVEIDSKTGKVKSYKYGDKSYPAWKVKHLRLLRVPGSHLGLGPIQSAQASLRGTIDLRDYATNWFRDGGSPNGVLKTEQVLSPEDMTRYQTAWDSNNRAGKTRIIGSGLNYQPIYLSPRDAQFLESQQFTKQEIATLFGVPAVYMLAPTGDSMTYQNVQQADLSFLKYTLTQYLSEIEQALSELLPRGQDARFVVEGFLRADRETRFEGHKTALEAGFLTINEVREIEGYRPLTDAEIAKAKPAPPVAPAPTEPEGESK